MLLIASAKALMFCYLLWHIKFIYLYLVIIEDHLFILIYGLSMYDLITYQMILLYYVCFKRADEF